LPPHQRVAWASPTSVYRHCPVFPEAKAGTPKGERPARRVHFEIAIDSIVESLLNKPVPERWKVIDRLTKALGLDGEAKPIKRKGTPTPLVWKDTGAGVPAPHHGYEAWTATGEYYTISPGVIFPTHKFSGYRVNCGSARRPDLRDHLGAEPARQAIETDQRHLRAADPRRREFRPEGDDRQQRQAWRRLDDQVEQFERRGIGPMRVSATSSTC
jgi:hypothetical protein